MIFTTNMGAILTTPLYATGREVEGDPLLLTFYGAHYNVAVRDNDPSRHMYQDKGLHVTVRPSSRTTTATALEQLGVPFKKRKYTSDEEDLLKILLPRYRSDFRGLADAWERVFMARGEFEGVVYNIDRRSLAQLKSKAQHLAGAETEAQKAVTRSDTTTHQTAQQPSQWASQAPHSPPPSQPPPSPPRTTTETDSQCPSDVTPIPCQAPAPLQPTAPTPTPHPAPALAPVSPN